MSWINDFVKSVAQTEKTVDHTVWKPFPPDALTPYYFNHLINKVLEVAEICQKDNITPEAIGKNWIGQSWLRNELTTVVWFDNFIKLNKKEKRNLIDFYLGLLYLNRDDPFSVKGITRIYNKKTLKIILAGLKWEKANKDKSRNLGFLITTLLTLTYTLYTDLFPSAGCEFHGPYHLDKDSILMIRDFWDIKPTPLWPDCQEFKYKSFTIFTVYKKAKFFIDCYGNITCDKIMPQILKNYGVVVDGKIINSQNQISELGDYFSQLTTEYYKKFENLNFEQTKVKFMEAHFYGYKKLLDLVKINWKPQLKAYQSIENKKLLAEKPESSNWQKNWKKSLKDLQIKFPYTHT